MYEEVFASQQAVVKGAHKLLLEVHGRVREGIVCSFCEECEARLKELEHLHGISEYI